MVARLPSQLVALLLVIPLGGCLATRLEYDRMVGTAYPQEENVDGEAVNLTSIYLQGDILLAVEEDDQDIDPLTGPADPLDPDQYDYITTAEIETLEMTHRASPVGPTEFDCSFWIFEGTCTRWHVYGIVVDHYFEYDDGRRRESLMGLAYDPAQRSAFANFYKNGTLRDDNAKFLRSTAHEIGHTFNLSHCDGDGDSTIMNQTRDVGDDFVFEFSAASLEHLQDHDRDAVWPGISGRDYDCPHVH